MDQRIAAYLRVSTSEQSVDLQKSEINRYVLARGFGEPIWYEDLGTGTNDNRLALKRLMADVRLRKVDVVICWKLDRLFRSMKHMVLALNDFSELGIQFISLKDQIDMTTATGRLMTHILSAFAEFEADLIRGRVRAGLENAKRKGKRLGRPSRINAQKAMELRQNGLSLAAISKQLNVSRSTVSKTLKKMNSQISENRELKNKNRGVEKTEV
jgi:putative DNA-invertase from lambdoid prophage Rac